MHTPDQTHKERLYLDINLQLMQKNVPEIKWLIVLLVKEVKKYFKSEKEEIEQSLRKESKVVQTKKQY